jgi:hypothetical protein
MAQRTHKFGVDANRPIVIEPGTRLGGLAETVADPDAIAESGAAWVRINFVLGPWLSPTDRSRFQGRTWAETYATIIDRFRDRGLNVYGLIGHEAVKTQPDFFRDPQLQMTAADVVTAKGWLARYAAHFSEIVGMFAGRVTIFEMFNEPDDWHGASRPWIHPTWFAELLDTVYRKVKLGLGAQPVQLISGPLQGLEVNENRAPTQYLRETYEYGKQALGWGQPGRPYPFDGVGYHLYIREGYTGDWSAHEYQVRQLYRHYLDGVLRVIRAAEGPGTTRRLYLSEFGWPSNRNTPEELTFQARSLRLALELLQAEPAVALAIWFCTEDFDPGHKHYGLYHMRRVTADGRKPAFYYFKEFCQRFGTGALWGTLRNQAGAFQSGYQLTLSGPGGSRSAITGADGAFRFDGLPAGTHTLSIGGTTVTRTVECDGRSAVRIDLVLPQTQAPRSGSVTGVVRDSAGRPVAGRRVTLSDATGTRSATTDAGGAYRFDGLAAGAYLLRIVDGDVVRNVWSNGMTAVAVDVTLPAPQAAQLGVISGTLRDPFGAPQAMRQIILTSELLSRTVSTDVMGRYRFDGLPAGVFTIHIEGVSAPQTVHSNGQTPVTLDLTLPAQPPPALASVSGRLRDQAGIAVAGRSITLELLSAGLVRTVNTDGQGTYRFEGLPGGSYRIRVEGTDIVRSVWLDGRAPVTLDLTLPAPVTPAGLGRIGGALRNRQGQPQPGRVVNLVGGGQSRSTVSGTAGEYRFDGLAAATYLLSVPAAGVARYVTSNGQTPTQVDLIIAG